jgi:hypothetical protein
MKNEEEILKNRANIKLNEIRIKAIVNLLSKEGIITHDEFEEEVENLAQKKDEENPEE